MYESHYGKGMKQGDTDYVVPGSPDARRSKAYSKDMYDKSYTVYGKKVSTKKNTTGTGAPTSGIQGDGGGNVAKSATYGKKKSYKSSYSGAAGKTSKGKPIEHKVKRYETKES